MSLKSDLVRGEAGEDLVHNHMSQWYLITLTEKRVDQRNGIDAIYESKQTGDTFTVEVKTDEMAGTTGNVFIEVISVDYPTKSGWVWTCKADKLLYWLPRQKQILIFELSQLQLHIREWTTRYGIKAVQNDGYQTYGCPVPIGVASDAASHVLVVE